jgi:hypothetical protein
MKHATFASLLLAACGGGDQIDPNEQELITTVVLTFEQPAGGPALTFEFDDPDGDGGDPPIADDIVLAPGTYALSVQFQNRLEDPPEEITDEVADESDQHLVLLLGSAVVGPATDNLSGPLTHGYADTDANGLPIGLDNDITAAAGTGTLNVVLRHMPPEEPPAKGADTLATVKSSGIEAIGGSSDASVEFPVTVQ